MNERDWQGFARACAMTRSCSVEPRAAWEREGADAGKLLESNRDAIVDAALGMVGELAEFIPAWYAWAAFHDEGDHGKQLALAKAGYVLWYCCEMSDAVGGFLMPDLCAKGHMCDGAFTFAGELCDMVKKWRSQGHDLDRQRACEIANTVAAIVMNNCSRPAAPEDFSAEYIVMENIENLERRYPDGFSAARSVNREG